LLFIRFPGYQHLSHAKSLSLQFGYDALIGESHDVSVVCSSDVELLAVPREQLQKAFTEDEYLKSVW